jgi:predicted transcriptional regulator
MPKSSNWFLARDIFHRGFTLVWTKAKNLGIKRKKSSRARTDVEAPVEGVSPPNKIIGEATAEEVERVSIELIENQDAEQVQTRIGTTPT